MPHYCILFIEPQEKECTWHFLVGCVDLNNYGDTNLGSIHNLPRRGGYDDFEGGHSFSLARFRGGGCGKFPTKMTSSGIGGPTIFFLKKNMK